MFYGGILTAYEGDDIDIADALELAECGTVGELYERAAVEAARFLSAVAIRDGEWRPRGDRPAFAPAP